MSELRMYINGEWVASESGEYFDAYNPATLEVIARVPQGTRKDADRAVLAAHAAKKEMARLSVWDRAKMVHRIADAMEGSCGGTRPHPVSRPGQTLPFRSHP